tara:strand:- start:946 stop:1200 length:255 start_codon:yes stop_codon:yes gene_type:complete
MNIEQLTYSQLSYVQHCYRYGIMGSQGGNMQYMANNLKDLMEVIQDNLLVAFDHLTDEEKTVMCQVVVNTVNGCGLKLTENQEA